MTICPLAGTIQFFMLPRILLLLASQVTIDHETIVLATTCSVFCYFVCYLCCRILGVCQELIPEIFYLSGEVVSNAVSSRFLTSQCLFIAVCMQVFRSSSLIEQPPVANNKREKKFKTVSEDTGK